MKRKGKEPCILVSVDGEFTGPIPGDYSMISLGAVAYSAKGRLVSKFSINLEELRGSSRHEETMNWWKQHPEAWKSATLNPVKAQEGMKEFASWLATLHGTPKLMGWPLPVDFMFVCWYYNHFIGKPPFGYDGVDIKTMAMAKLHASSLSDISRAKARKSIGIVNTDFSHDPTDDAIQQADIYFGLLKLGK